MIQEIIRDLINKAIRDLYVSIATPTEILIETARGNFGDYASNVAFVLAKLLEKESDVVGQEIAAKILSYDASEITRVEATDGYINFFLSQDFLRQQLQEIYQIKASFGQSNLGKGQTVIVEYSQPNIAKRMHLGHLRTTILGDALANIYSYLGFKVIRWNYLGDWGTQFGKLIAAYKKWGSKAAVEKDPIQTLLDLYIKFHEELKQNPELEKEGQLEFKKLEEGDQENIKLWQWFKQESIQEFNRMYELLDIKFDVDIGESFFEKDLKPLVEELIQKGIAQKSEEAIVVNLESDKLPPALIQKSDGSSLYLTRDIANLRYRLSTYNAKRILYVVDNGQSLHFQQLFAIAKILKLDQAKLEHIKFGLVLGEDKKKLATREGKSIFAQSVIDKVIGLAGEIVSQKNPDLSEDEKKNISQTVGLGALKYELLKEHRNTDIVFDWNKMLDFSGNSAPYLQYSYARLMSILAKAAKPNEDNFSEISDPTAFNVVKHLIEFPNVLQQCQIHNLTNPLALYLYELANFTNRFYEQVPVLKDENQKRLNAHLILIETTAQILQNGLKLLGIKTLPRI